MSLWVCVRELGFDSDGCLLQLDVWTILIGLGVLLIVSFFTYKLRRKPNDQEVNDRALQRVDYEENIRLLNEVLAKSASVIEGALNTVNSANGISDKCTQQPETSRVDKATETESESNGHSSNGHSSNDITSVSSNGGSSISSNGNSSNGSSKSSGIARTRSRSDAEGFKASLNFRTNRRPRLLAHPSLIRVAETNILRNPTALRVAGRKKYIRPVAGAFDAVYLLPRKFNGKKSANGGSLKRRGLLYSTAAEAESMRQNESDGSVQMPLVIMEGAAASGAEGAAASGAEGAAASGAEGAAASGAEGAAASGAEGAAASGAEGAAASGAEGAAASGAEGAAASGAEGAAASGAEGAAASGAEGAAASGAEGAAASGAEGAAASGAEGAAASGAEGAAASGAEGAAASGAVYQKFVSN
ncbi:WAG22 antigen-like isoform X1 [Palaemon carinicauda]|uniref:WAG22 antigen-like isoform X1 n=1 Tax=Palaemon carinicauda TaxID=392227 RepID=UPI0035B5E0BF